MPILDLMQTINLKILYPRRQALIVCPSSIATTSLLHFLRFSLNLRLRTYHPAELDFVLRPVQVSDVRLETVITKHELDCPYSRSHLPL